jgi:hypothetical protein
LSPFEPSPRLTLSPCEPSPRLTLSPFDSSQVLHGFPRRSLRFRPFPGSKVPSGAAPTSPPIGLSPSTWGRRCGAIASTVHQPRLLRGLGSNPSAGNKCLGKGDGKSMKGRGSDASWVSLHLAPAVRARVAPGSGGEGQGCT